ncbi:hypothetical protein GJ654_10290 [Rhodoblastus acidophilus]|uniref:Uncharacterized protein n=1 Tax=Rhodoblastus acidophilus TaxID=1074 RepID=A0A6N8DLB1_RHOAC|nr:hypothetical protein [Rhodoblastus acidophilus]MCW2275113.1 hypothetical protein [Rhodoblastus acidophilus]MTV31382.1 hypothetical protein [Rhodoblastus acidophilus]
MFEEFDIEYSTGKFVSDLTNVAECDNAMDELLLICSSIEEQLKQAKYNARFGNQVDTDWERRTISALKIKRLARQQVSVIRGRMAKSERKNAQESIDRKLLETIKKFFPKEFFRAVEIMKSEN